MFQTPEILRMAHALASHAALRQDATARNVANADTPGYRAVDAARFADIYQDAAAGHDDPVQWIVQPGEAAPNGNTVSLETEMVRAAEIRQQHDMALAVYHSASKILRLGLGRQG